MKLSEALNKYVAFGTLKNAKSSMSVYMMHIKHLILYFRDCDIEDVKFQDLIDYTQLMLKIGWDKNSLVAKCSAYKQFFLFFQGQGIVKFNSQDIPVPTPQTKFPKIIEEPDYLKLLKVIDGFKNSVSKFRDRTLLMMLWDTGVRLNELRSLNVEDLDLKQMRTVIKTEKSKGVRPVRMVFWTKQTNESLKVYLKSRQEYLKSRKIENNALFINSYGRFEGGGRWSESAIEHLCKVLSYKANLGYVANPHRFRHHFGRKLALQGANNSVISDMMGHSSMESTRIYTVMNEQMMQDIYTKHFRD